MANILSRQAEAGGGAPEEPEGTDAPAAGGTPAGNVLTIGRAEQLKALGHPLRLRVLEVLGESGEELTNRELAIRLGVDPGHLHFHVRMLAGAGLIERVEGGRGREKPYRAVAANIRVAPELLKTGLANDARTAMLNDVQEGWSKHLSANRFRSAQMTVRMDPERVRELWRTLVAEAEDREDQSREPLLITLFAHPHPTASESRDSDRDGG
jgi:DNA-binding transcriptional ArsR family regulator